MLYLCVCQQVHIYVCVCVCKQAHPYFNHHILKNIHAGGEASGNRGQRASGRKITKAHTTCSKKWHNPYIIPVIAALCYKKNGTVT